MENSNGSSNLRNFPYVGRQTLVPFKSPFPCISPSYVDYSSSPVEGSNGIPKPTEGRRHLQRTSSEGFLIEEQPSWLEELLNEPETPVHRGHRRSSSDSFAYFDAAAKASNRKEEYKFKNITAGPSWGSQNFDHYKNLGQASFYKKPSSSNRQQNRGWESSLNSVTCPSGLPPTRDDIVSQNSGSSCASQEPDGLPSIAIGKQDQEESVSHNLESSAGRSDCSHATPSVSRADPKRAKQQFAQRSRVRKLQYIAELERNVQTLQAEGFEVSAELEFLDQQNLILGMENRALKQRLDSLSQEQLIKYLEQDMLEREIGRLQTLYQQHQQQQHYSTHHRAKSTELGSQLANLSIKYKEGTSYSNAVSGSLHI